ncbi:MAG: hypothetical protein LBB45_08785 [Methanobrevibacter sp.]|jgi:hypothetical protein|nr:hypothetical protein [Candidatus Methanovirga basalitermitum]
MTIKSYNKDMEFLLPKKLRDYVNPDDNCLLVEKVIEYLKTRHKYKEECKKYKCATPSWSFSKIFIIYFIINIIIDRIFMCSTKFLALKLSDHINILLLQN